MLMKINHYLYLFYYRLYYFFFGRKAIDSPKSIIPSKIRILCSSQIDPEMRKHHNFLFAQVKPMKWLYWRRKFAFRVLGTDQWFALPKLTPWDTKDGLTRFGLNYTFVQKWAGYNLEYITWI